MTVKFTLHARLTEIGAAETTLAALDGHLRVKSFRAGETVLQQGDQAPNVFYLNSGLVKLVYFTAQGNEFTKSFISEGSLMGSLVSQLTGGPSPFSIVCLEPAVIEVLPFAVLKDLVDRDEAVLRFTYTLFQNLALKKEIREHDFLCLTPAERYRKFLNEHAATAKRLKQVEIARYLGITPVALSRIKSRMKRSSTISGKAGVV